MVTVINATIVTVKVAPRIRGPSFSAGFDTRGMPDMFAQMDYSPTETTVRPGRGRGTATRNDRQWGRGQADEYQRFNATAVMSPS